MSKRKAVALDAALKKMFRTLEDKPVPNTIGSIFDHLEAQAAPPLRKAS